MVVVGTGHRPPRLGLGYDPASNKKLTVFAEVCLRKLSRDGGVASLVSGMAQGWDQALAHAAVNLGIPLVCVLPFEGMGDNWPESGRRRRDALLAKAKEVVALYPSYKAGGNKSYVERDRDMVDRAGRSHGVVLACWDGVKDGGTWATVDYANKKNVPVSNVWEGWQSFGAVYLAQTQN